MTNRYHLYVHSPVPIFKAKVVVSGTLTYPVTELEYNAVTLGAYTDIQPGMTLFLGSSDGADDLGRVRVKSAAAADSIPIPRTARGVEDGTLDIGSGAFITVLDDYRVWTKIPFFDLDTDGDTPGNDFKDGDLVAGDNNTNIPPVANCGPGIAGYIDSLTSLLTVQFPNWGVNNSFAVADGATITDYLWDVGDGTITVGTAASDVITVTFPAGFRWVSLTVTDSNAKTHTARCPVLAIDPADDPTLRNWQMTQRLEERGQTLDIQLQEPLLRSTYPDGTLVMFWWEPLVGVDPGDRDQMKFIGWMEREVAKIGRKQEGVRRGTTLHCLDVTGRLTILPAFPQALEREESDSPWSVMPSLDMAKQLYYLLAWHSTALDLADFILPSDLADYDAMRLDTTGRTLFEQVNGQAQKLVPDHYLTCNSQGQLVVMRDWMLDDVGDRPTAAPVLTENDWNDLGFDYNRHPPVHLLRSGAILSSTDWVTVDGEDTLPLVFSIAPGDAAAFSQGTREQSENEGLALSQADLNTCEGHRYALLNSRYGLFNFTDPTVGDFWTYQPAYFTRIQLNISDEYAHFRNLEETQLIGRVREMTVAYQAKREGTVRSVSVSFQKEESGAPALTYDPETGDVTPVPYTPPIISIPPPDDLYDGVEQLALLSEEGYLFRTADFQTPASSGGPTWDKVDLGEGPFYTWVVDPFSPGYLYGTGFVNGWAVDADDIWRIEDIFGTPTIESVHTFATTAAVASHHWRTIQASFGTYFESGSNPWLLCISYYGATGSHTGTWATYSVDGGATWADEVQISAEYDSALTDPNPIGVYTSPKTPGLAYTAAHVETTGPAQSDGYVSTDWGATWTRLGADPPDDETDPLPHWGLWNRDSQTMLSVRNSPAITYDEYVYCADSCNNITPEYDFLLAPPANAVRVVVQGSFGNGRVEDGGTSGGIAWSEICSVDTTPPSGLSLSGSVGFVHDTSGNFTLTWTKTGGSVWAGNRDQLEAETYTNQDSFAYLRFKVQVTTSGDHEGSNYLRLAARVTEIELSNGHIYEPPLVGAGLLQPVHGQAGAVHLPWPDNADEEIAFSGALDRLTNRTFGLMRSVAGVAAASGPTESGVTYGVNRPGFGVRTYDNNRTYAAFVGKGNGTSASAADDQNALFVSDDSGASWTLIDGPDAAATPHATEVAFAADSEQVLFAWGTDGYIQYSEDFGATLDDRSGNLATVNGGSAPSLIIGICGGPV